MEVKFVFRSWGHLAQLLQWFPCERKAGCTGKCDPGKTCICLDFFSCLEQITSLADVPVASRGYGSY